jgi:hypothetical protein
MGVFGGGVFGVLVVTWVDTFPGLGYGYGFCDTIV